MEINAGFADLPNDQIGCKFMGLAPAVDQFDRHRNALAGRKIGLVTNSAARSSKGRTTAEILGADPDLTLVRVFAPEHGFDLTEEAGETVPDSRLMRIPVISLHGKRLAPEAAHLADLNVLVIDLPSMSVRCFTYLATALLCLRAAASVNCPVVIMDRPNPLGRVVEAPVGSVRQNSLLCPLAIPLRYGMTLGEVLRLAAAEENLPSPDVCVCESAGDNQQEQIWWAPSPNLPSLASALVYPGTVLIEGTALSEGRGTDAPFCNIGAPEIPADRIAEFVGALDLPGLKVEPTTFVPKSSKHQDAVCSGIRIAVTDQELAQPVTLMLYILGWLRDEVPELLQPTSMLDALFGDPQLRNWCQDRQSTVETLTANWQSSILAFEKRRRPYLLYDC